MLHARAILFAIAASLTAFGSHAADPPPPSPGVQSAVEQLRQAQGRWDVTTSFYADGKVARTAAGAYEFEWVVPDRVLSGKMSVPDLGLASGILFYVHERKGLIEMVSVGGDGHLWVMTGKAGEEVRMTPPTPLSNGTTQRLRFTRFNVASDRFESKMEYTTDDGKTWTQGNHQIFTRVK